MSQQATKKRRRSAKQQTLRQFVEAVRNRSKVTHLGFVYKVQVVHRWTREALLAGRGDLEYMDGLIPTMLDLSIATDVLIPDIGQRLSTWPESPGIAFGEKVAPSALELIVDTGGLLGWLCLYGCPALWNPKLSGPILSTGKNAEVIEDNRDKAIRWDAKLTPGLLSTWHEQARTAINEQLPPAEQFPDWRLNREWNAVILAFLNELRRWEARGGSGGWAAEGETLPPLSAKQAVVWEILLELPLDRGLTGGRLLEALRQRGVYSDQSTLTKWIIPALKLRGVENKRKVGYFIPANRRPAK